MFAAVRPERRESLDGRVGDRLAEVVTIVHGVVSRERFEEVRGPYRDALKIGPPRGIEQTFLLRSISDDVAIVTFWHTRADLEAMLASGQEPLARRLISGAGGGAQVSVYDVLAASPQSGESGVP